MNDAIEIRRLTPSEVSAVLPKLNQEFVFSKGRMLPVEVRFPELFAPRNFKNLFGLFVNGALASFVAVKPVTIVKDGKEFEAFFVGAVFTDNQYRGKGFSSQLMTYVQDHYLSLGVKLGILWTGINAFYEKLGWVTADNGVFVSCCSPKESIKAGSSVKIEELEDCLLPQIDALRLSQGNLHIKRGIGGVWNGYRTVYPSGERLLRLVSYDKGGGVSGYLLGATNQKDCFVYEINAIHQKCDLIRAFLGHIYKKYSCDSLKINLSKNDPLTDDLNNLYEKLIIQKTNIQMFLCEDDYLSDVARDFYVSFSDRI
jgi:GNAT superfamily N-acetyltransferase